MQSANDVGCLVRSSPPPPNIKLDVASFHAFQTLESLSPHVNVNPTFKLLRSETHFRHCTPTHIFSTNTKFRFDTAFFYFDPSSNSPNAAKTATKHKTQASYQSARKSARQGTSKSTSKSSSCQKCSERQLGEPESPRRSRRRRNLRRQRSIRRWKWSDDSRTRRG